MQRIGKTIFVWAVVLLTAVDPAAACRWRSRRCCRPARCYYYCYAPVDCCGSPAAGAATYGTPTPAAARPAESTPDSFAPYAPAPSQPTPAQPAPLRPAPSAPAPLPPAPLPGEIPPADVPPADTLPESPAESPLEAPAEPKEEMPPEPAAPAKPAEEVEDLFKDSGADKPATETPAPAEKSEDVEDLFKESDDKGKAASNEPAPSEEINQGGDKAVEDLFSEPADDMNKSAAAETAAPETVAAAAKAAAPPSVENRDESSSAMRLWTDNTGKYQVRAKLVVVGDKYVRLLKDTGKYTTVPIERLSHDDLAFVRHNVTSVVAGNF